LTRRTLIVFPRNTTITVNRSCTNDRDSRITSQNPLLHDLLILQTIRHKGLIYYVLHESFKKGLRGALTGG